MIAALALAATAPIAVGPDLLAGLPPVSVTLTAHGGSQVCTGVSLRAVLTRAGLPEGAAIKGPALSTVVVAEARDGYRVLFTLAEIDPALGARPVALVDRCDGKPLDAEDGPYRLVVPGEQRAARSVRQLIRLRIKAVD